MKSIIKSHPNPQKKKEKRKKCESLTMTWQKRLARVRVKT